MWIAWNAITADIPDDDWEKLLDEYFENTWIKSKSTLRMLNYFNYKGHEFKQTTFMVATKAHPTSKF